MAPKIYERPYEVLTKHTPYLTRALRAWAGHLNATIMKPSWGLGCQFESRRMPPPGPSKMLKAITAEASRINIHVWGHDGPSWKHPEAMATHHKAIVGPLGTIMTQLGATTTQLCAIMTRELQDGPKGAHDGPKEAPRRPQDDPKTAPRRSQDVPRWPERDPQPACKSIRKRGRSQLVFSALRDRGPRPTIS